MVLGGENGCTIFGTDDAKAQRLLKLKKGMGNVEEAS